MEWWVGLTDDDCSPRSETRHDRVAQKGNEEAKLQETGDHLEDTDLHRVACEQAV